MKKLRVGFDASGLTSGKPPTGLERYSASLLAHLAACRDAEDFDLFLYMIPPVNRTDPRLAAVIPDRSLHWRTAPFVRGWNRLGMGSLMLLDRLDVFHFPSPRMPTFCPVPSVVTIHDMAALSLGGGYTAKESEYLENLLDAGRRADALIVVSRSTGQEIETHLGRTDYTLIHEGVDVRRFSPAPAESVSQLRAELGLDRYILCVGTLQARKNHVRLVEAFERIQDTIPHSLVFAGRDGSGADQLRRALAERPNPRIRLLGHVPESQLPVLYSGADAFAFPSLWEGFGLPLLEAMACDVPVLTSGNSGMYEVADDASLIVDPYDVQAIADGLQRIIRDERLRAELTSKGRLRASRMSWDQAAQRTAQLYREVAMRKRRM